jgi:hypothetical protein
MSAKDYYCIVDGWKRLKEKGFTPSEANDIAQDVYKKVKKSCQTTHKQ